jgi:hypothetical protein
MILEAVTTALAVCLIDTAGLSYCRPDEAVCCHVMGSPPVVMKLSDCMRVKEEFPGTTWTRPRADGTCVQHLVPVD